MRAKVSICSENLSSIVTRTRQRESSRVERVILDLGLALIDLHVQKGLGEGGGGHLQTHQRAALEGEVFKVELEVPLGLLDVRRVDLEVGVHRGEAGQREVPVFACEGDGREIDVLAVELDSAGLLTDVNRPGQPSTVQIGVEDHAGPSTHEG